MRKRTVIKLCKVHANLSGNGRRWVAEMFCEGGPAYGPHCDELEPCAIRPGSDIFAPTATDDVADGWVDNWTVNQYVERWAR